MSETKLNITVEELAAFIYANLPMESWNPLLDSSQDAAYSRRRCEAYAHARRMRAADALYEAATDLLKHRIHDVTSEVIHKSYFLPLEQALALADGKEE